MRTGFLKDYVAEPATTTTLSPPQADEPAHEMPVLGEVHTVEDGCCPFKIVFDEDLYVVFDEDLYVLFM